MSERVLNKVRRRVAWALAPSDRNELRDAWANTPTPTGAVVLLGDSLLARWPIEFLTPVAAPLAPRAIPGETTDQLLARIEDVLRLEPSHIVLLTGTNSVLQSVDGEAIVRQQQEVLTRCRSALPRSQLIVLTLPPIGKVNVADAVRFVNAGLAECAEQFSATLVDIYVRLVDESGRPARGVLIDDVHLAPEAYSRVTPLLRSAIPVLSAPPVDAGHSPP